MPYCKVNEISLYYEIYGEGYPLVLIPGLGSQMDTWANQIKSYAKQYQVIVLDNRGSGLSEKPDQPYSMEIMADDIILLLDELNIAQAHIIGKSMGGMIAQQLAVKYPQRINKLVLACTAARHDQLIKYILQMARQTAEKIGLSSVIMLSSILSLTRGYLEETFDEMEDRLKHLDADSAEEFLTGYLRQSLACEQHDFTAALKKIQARTLVLVGDNDLIVSPKLSKELAEKIPAASLHIFKGLGHSFWREQPDLVDAVVLAFLSEA